MGFDSELWTVRHVFGFSVQCRKKEIPSIFCSLTTRTLSWNLGDHWYDPSCYILWKMMNTVIVGWSDYVGTITFSWPPLEWGFFGMDDPTCRVESFLSELLFALLPILYGVRCPTRLCTRSMSLSPVHEFVLCFASALWPHSSVADFADDTTVLFWARRREQTCLAKDISVFNDYLRKISPVFSSLRLSISAAKTKLLVSRSSRFSVPRQSAVMGSPGCCWLSYLSGFAFDETLTWHFRVVSTREKLHSVVFRLHRLRRFGF